jgi:hypothetical protein
VIILGISITLALEAWRENSKEKDLEKIYLNNLLSDVEVDLKSLSWVSARTEQLLNRGNELLGYIRIRKKRIFHSAYTEDRPSGQPKFIPVTQLFQI